MQTQLHSNINTISDHLVRVDQFPLPLLPGGHVAPHQLKWDHHHVPGGVSWQQASTKAAQMHRSVQEGWYHLAGRSALK